MSNVGFWNLEPENDQLYEQFGCRNVLFLTCAFHWFLPSLILTVSNSISGTAFSDTCDLYHDNLDPLRVVIGSTKSKEIDSTRLQSQIFSSI